MEPMIKLWHFDHLKSQNILKILKWPEFLAAPSALGTQCLRPTLALGFAADLGPNKHIRQPLTEKEAENRCHTSKHKHRLCLTGRKTAHAKKRDRNDTGSRGKVVPINPGVQNRNLKLQSHYTGNETNYYTINNQRAGSQMKLQNPIITISRQTVLILDLGNITLNVTAGKC